MKRWRAAKWNLGEPQPYRSFGAFVDVGGWRDALSMLLVDSADNTVVVVVAPVA